MCLLVGFKFNRRLSLTMIMILILMITNHDSILKLNREMVSSATNLIFDSIGRKSEKEPFKTTRCN